MSKNYQWAAVQGNYTFGENLVVFRGEEIRFGELDEKNGAAIGNAICNQVFSGGRVSAKITFSKVSPESACELILFYDPLTRVFVSAGLSRESLFTIKHFNERWFYHFATGDGQNLKAGTTYYVEATLLGSRVRLRVDGVDVGAANLPFSPPQSQPGLFCRDVSDISVADFRVETEIPRAFVVMQFSSPYNELYEEVIKPVCNELGVDARRADDTFEPGLIIADVTRQIQESKLIIAEITPSNPNVYYEVGYAHAMNKPTILIADKQIDRLPFDVSPFRTLFYENSINGKRKVEEGLRRHIKAVLLNNVL